MSFRASSRFGNAPHFPSVSIWIYSLFDRAIRIALIKYLTALLSLGMIASFPAQLWQVSILVLARPWYIQQCLCSRCTINLSGYYEHASTARVT